MRMLSLQQEESKKQKLLIYFIAGIMLLAIAFAVFAYKSYLEKRRKEKQLTRKNTEITDSINSALRIQQAMLPKTRRSVAITFAESFCNF